MKWFIASALVLAVICGVDLSLYIHHYAPLAEDLSPLAGMTERVTNQGGQIRVVGTLTSIDESSHILSVETVDPLDNTTRQLSVHFATTTAIRDAANAPSTLAALSTALPTPILLFVRNQPGNFHATIVRIYPQ